MHNKSRCARQTSSAPIAEKNLAASAAAATAATVVCRITVTAVVTTTVVFEQQQDTDDEQDPRPGAVVPTEQIGQTHNKFLL